MHMTFAQIREISWPAGFRLRLSPQAWAILAAFLLLLAYITYHFFNGERGLFALHQLTDKRMEIQQDLENIRAERLNLEHRVHLLRSESLDIDLLDEQARAMLGVAASDEKIVLP